MAPVTQYAQSSGASIAYQAVGDGPLGMYASMARTSWAPDYEWAMTVEEREEFAERGLTGWGELDKPAIAQFTPSLAEDPAHRAWFARLERLAASPGEARAMAK